MKKKSNKSICLVLPTLSSGGMERVMSQLAFYFVDHQYEVSIILMTKSEQFYGLPNEVKVFEPTWNYRKHTRIVFSLKILSFVRKTLKDLNPDGVLSFGGRYNSFVLLASLGLGLNVFVSDRSRPSLSYGKLQDVLNPILYRKAKGIIAQTEQSKEMLWKMTNHDNICIIGNPIRSINGIKKRENIILNVGRFIATKNQDCLLDYFRFIKPNGWKLVFLGDGPLLEETKLKNKDLVENGTVVFKGNVKDIDDYFLTSSIFAFTSQSEGFPNALGEAMSAGMPCISFDCEAGPADLINNGVNGFLVAVGDHSTFKTKLISLSESEELRALFSAAAKETMLTYLPESIGHKFETFIFSSK